MHRLSQTLDHPLFPWLLFLLAFALRANAIDLVQFNIDEGYAAIVGTQIAHFHRFPLTGVQTSFGFYNPPLLFYIVAPIFGATRDPRFACLLLSLLGSLAVVLVWKTARLISGRQAALAAAVLLAVCPNGVEYGRRLWGSDFIPFLSAAALYAAAMAWKTRDSRWLGLSFCCGGAAQALHLSGALLWFPGIALLAHRAVDRPLRGVAIGIGFTVLVYLPWFANELLEGFPDLRLVPWLLFGGAGTRDLGIPVHPLGAWCMVLGDFWNNDLLGHLRPWMTGQTAAIASGILSPLAIAFLAAGIVSLVLSWKRSPEMRPILSAILAPLLVTPLVFGGLIRASVPPYLLPALVPAVLGVGWFASCLYTERGRAVLTMLFLVYTASSLVLIISVRGYLAESHDASVPLRERMAVIEEIEFLAGERDFFVMQNARNPRTGIDVAYLYLLHWRHLSERARPSPEDSQAFFVIVDNRVRIRPEPIVFLRHMPSVTFPRLTLYEVQQGRVDEWLDILERYPAPGS